MYRLPPPAATRRRSAAELAASRQPLLHRAVSCPPAPDATFSALPQRARTDSRQPVRAASNLQTPAAAPPPATDWPAPEPIQPLDDFRIVGAAASAAATQDAFWATGPDERVYRLKRYPPERAGNTCHEFLSAYILHALGLPYSPQLLLASAPAAAGAAAGELWLASPLIAGSKDVGPFLVEDGLAHVAPEYAAAYARELGRHGRAAAAAAAERQRPEVQALLQRYPKGGFAALTLPQHELLQPLRRHERAALRCQDRMLELLPPGYRSALRYAFYASEVVGEWDFWNHRRYNTVIGLDGRGGQPRASTVDRGVSGLIGFGGRFKRDSLAAANQPARIDDPYAEVPTPRCPGGYRPANVVPADLDFTRVAPSFGLIGAIPRGAVSAPLLREVVRNERELQGDRAGPGLRPPDEALEIAARLAALPPGHLRQHLEALFAIAAAHPDAAVRRLFTPAVSGVSGAVELARLYEARLRAIVARAERNGELARWRQRRRNRAQAAPPPLPAPPGMSRRRSRV